MREVFCLYFAGAHHEVGLAHDGTPKSLTPDRPLASTGGARSLRTPVALLVFARPDTTQRLLAAVRVAKPERLLVVADAPSPSDPQLAARCAEVRALIEAVDWDDCEVLTSYAADHMGLNRRVETGLDWVFSTVEEAIVLEDDCIPHPTFFPFCQEMLARYREDTRVMSISGDNFDRDPTSVGDGYRYSRYPLIWGWATWRRAWRRHDPRMARWPSVRDTRWLEKLFGGDRHAVTYWSHHFEQTYRGAGSWDYAWVFTSWLHGGLTVVPDVNLVTNVGFRADATHTREDDHSPFANLPTRPARSPLRHPAEVIRDVEADRWLEEVLFSGSVRRMFERLRSARQLAQPSPRSR